MELLSSFTLNPLRIYTVPKRIKNKKGISTFPEKHIASYLDYSVDFSNLLSDGERIIQGKVLCNHTELIIHTVCFRSQYLMAFLSGGKEGLSFYLTFIIQTNKGNEFCQEIILSTYGCFQDKHAKTPYKMLALDTETQAPTDIPPLNALSINEYYLIYKKNSYVMV